MYKATRKAFLLAHIKFTHEGIKYPRDQCDQKATRRDHLLTHYWPISSYEIQTWSWSRYQISL